MTESNPDLVQRQLSELTQQTVQVMEAFNNQKEILEEEYDLV